METTTAQNRMRNEWLRGNEMLEVEQKVCNLTEEQLETAYNEFKQFKETGVIGQSLIRDLYNEHKIEIDSRVGYWIGIELMIMNEIARRYYGKQQRTPPRGLSGG